MAMALDVVPRRVSFALVDMMSSVVRCNSCGSVKPRCSSRFSKLVGTCGERCSGSPLRLRPRLHLGYLRFTAVRMDLDRSHPPPNCGFIPHLDLWSSTGRKVHRTPVFVHRNGESTFWDAAPS
nr:hypothetical protein CFP56_08004 [Quercus suber]